MLGYLFYIGERNKTSLGYRSEPEADNVAREVREHALLIHGAAEINVL